MEKSEKPQKLGLYIHIPFCEKKCHYCDFYSITDKKYIDSYIIALDKEIEKYQDQNITSVYVGGGSPSVLNVAQITGLFRSVCKLNLSNCVEMTIEINPSQVSEEKLRTYLTFGVNRISVGVQSFNDKLLKNVGRIHDGKQAINTLNMAKKAGFKNISADLIYGLPGENITDLQEDIKKAADLGVNHISAYSLMLEENTPLYKMVAENKIILPTEEKVEEMYDFVSENLPALGYSRYEISNFAKLGYECKHNLLYWSDYPYIGVGSTAAGFVNNVRYKNNCTVKEYIERIKVGANVNVEENRTKEDALFEYIFLALRKIEGLNKTDFSNKFNADIEIMYNNEIAELKNLKLLEENENFLYLTPKGLKVSNMVFEKFIT